MDNRCVSCGKTVEDKYCMHCGEKILTDKDRSISTLFSDATENILNLDIKLFRTIWVLISKPGYLTVEYWKGKRILYLKPLQLLILLNLLYFFASYVSHNLNFNYSIMVPSLNDLTSGRIFSPMALNIIQSKINSSHLDFNAYQNVFNIHLEEAAKSLVILLVPIVSVFLMLVQIHQKILYHIVAAAHLISFYILLSSCYLLSGSLINFYITPVSINLFKYFPLTILLLYLFFSFKTLYQKSNLFLLIFTVSFIFIAVPIITNIYDLILFFVVFLIV